MKAILVHREPVPGLSDHLARLEALPMRALSVPAKETPPAAVAAFVELWGPVEALRAAVSLWPEPVSAWLVDESPSERSAMALGLAAICLTVHDRPAEKPLEALAAAGEATGFLDNAHLVSLALVALTLGTHRGRAFRVGSDPS